MAEFLNLPEVLLELVGGYSGGPEPLTFRLLTGPTAATVFDLQRTLKLWSHKDARKRDRYAFRSLCGAGRLAHAKAFAKLFDFRPVDARAGSHYAMRVACEHGHLHVARWLVAEFGFTVPDMRTMNSRALRNACANGHTATAQWVLSATGPGNPQDVLWAFFAACEHGHLPLAHWVVDTFKNDTFVNDDVSERAWLTGLLGEVCSNGHLSTAQWLCDRFGLSGKEALGGALRNGHLPVVKWLVAHFSITAGDIQIYAGYGLYSAQQNRHHTVVKWVMETFGLDVAPLSRVGWGEPEWYLLARQKLPEPPEPPAPPPAPTSIVKLSLCAGAALGIVWIFARCSGRLR